MSLGILHINVPLPTVSIVRLHIILAQVLNPTCYKEFFQISFTMFTKTNQQEENL